MRGQMAFSADDLERADAKAIETYFINEKKMKGGTGGTISAQTKWIYVL